MIRCCVEKRGGLKGGMRSEAIAEQSEIKTGAAAEATGGGGSGLGRDARAPSATGRATRGGVDGGEEEC